MPISLTAQPPTADHKDVKEGADDGGDEDSRATGDASLSVTAVMNEPGHELTLDERLFVEARDIHTRESERIRTGNTTAGGKRGSAGSRSRGRKAPSRGRSSSPARSRGGTGGGGGEGGWVSGKTSAAEAKDGKDVKDEKDEGGDERVSSRTSWFGRGESKGDGGGESKGGGTLQRNTAGSTAGHGLIPVSSMGAEFMDGWGEEDPEPIVHPIEEQVPPVLHPPRLGEEAAGVSLLALRAYLGMGTVLLERCEKLNAGLRRVEQFYALPSVIGLADRRCGDMEDFIMDRLRPLKEKLAREAKSRLRMGATMAKKRAVLEKMNAQTKGSAAKHGGGGDDDMSVGSAASSKTAASGRSAPSADHEKDDVSVTSKDTAATNTESAGGDGNGDDKKKKQQQKKKKAEEPEVIPLTPEEQAELDEKAFFEGLDESTGRALVAQLARMRMLALMRCAQALDSAAEILRGWGWDPASPDFHIDAKDVHPVATHFRVEVYTLGYSRGRVLVGLGAVRDGCDEFERTLKMCSMRNYPQYRKIYLEIARCQAAIGDFNPARDKVNARRFP